MAGIIIFSSIYPLNERFINTTNRAAIQENITLEIFLLK